MSPFVIGVVARMAVQVIAFAQIMIAARFIDMSGFGTYTLGWSTIIFTSTRESMGKKSSNKSFST